MHRILFSLSICMQCIAHIHIHISLTAIATAQRILLCWWAIVGVSYSPCTHVGKNKSHMAIDRRLPAVRASQNVNKLSSDQRIWICLNAWGGQVVIQLPQSADWLSLSLSRAVSLSVCALRATIWSCDSKCFEFCVFIVLIDLWLAIQLFN